MCISGASNLLSKYKMRPLPSSLSICFSCSYTNADQLFNKMAELIVRTRDNKPNIIGITEVKPKLNRYKPALAEFSLTVLSSNVHSYILLFLLQRFVIVPREAYMLFPYQTYQV
jgi:hypothetical protein